MGARSARATAVAWWVCAAAAAAQTPPPDAAAERRALIAQAADARDHGDLPRALALGRRAVALRSTPSLRLLLAEIEDSLGEVPSALADARQCELELEADRAHHDWQRYYDACHARVVALEARDAPPGVTTVAAVPVAAVPVAAVPVAAVPVAAVPVAAVPVEAVRGGVAPIAPRRRGRAATTTVGPWIVVGLGGASLAAAGIFFALRGDALADRDAACGTAAGDCAPTSDAAVTAASTAQRDAHTFNALTNVALGVGGAALAGGLAWWLLGRGAPAPQGHALAVSPVGDGAMLWWRGTL